MTLYTANGSTTNDSLHQYVYDARGRLVRAVGLLGTTTYQVNALGQRMRKTNRTEDRVYLYDVKGRLIAEATPAGAITREYLYLNDIALAVASAGNVSYIHVDHLNTPRLIANQAGTTVWRWDQTEPFGLIPPNENPSGLANFTFNSRFPGQYFDRETNLNYNFFRDYDPNVGRYVESDPIGLAAGLNTYAYVSGNPISNFDPFGLADLTYDPNSRTLTVTDSNGNVVGVFPAANNAQSGSIGPLRAGTYDYSYSVSHPGDAPNSAFGSYGNFVFNVPGCIGCGVHSGRANSTDRAGRTGVNFATNGCIRTTDEGTNLIKRLLGSDDPIRTLTVNR